jgi:hypothetical protein
MLVLSLPNLRALHFRTPKFTLETLMKMDRRVFKTICTVKYDRKGQVSGYNPDSQPGVDTAERQEWCLHYAKTIIEIDQTLCADQIYSSRFHTSELPPVPSKTPNAPLSLSSSWWANYIKHFLVRWNSVLRNELTRSPKRLSRIIDIFKHLVRSTGLMNRDIRNWQVFCLQFTSVLCAFYLADNCTP